jgi:cell cycle sensor histidine kinase DivJ
MALKAREQSIDLVVRLPDELPEIVADSRAFRQIMINLLSNAVKFTPADGKVEVRADKKGEEFVLTVSDTGMGISENQLRFVFDRFWQADSSSKRKHQGAGIGLALVKGLVEKHGGNWIVLVEGKLIGISKPKDVGKLIQQAKAKHPHSLPFASPIPTREELECLL